VNLIRHGHFSGWSKLKFKVSNPKNADYTPGQKERGAGSRPSFATTQYLLFTPALSLHHTPRRRKKPGS
jgi:hypothetical protein